MYVVVEVVAVHFWLEYPIQARDPRFVILNCFRVVATAAAFTC